MTRPVLTVESHLLQVSDAERLATSSLEPVLWRTTYGPQNDDALWLDDDRTSGLGKKVVRRPVLQC